MATENTDEPKSGRYCEYCGRPLPAAVRYCGYCGKELVHAIEKTALPPLSRSTSAQTRTLGWIAGRAFVRFRRAGPKAWYPAAALLVLVAAFIAWQSMPDANPPAAVEQIKDSPAVTSLTPAQHLENAQLALKSGASLAEISEGLRHLAEIPASAPEAEKAKAMGLESKLTRAQGVAARQEAIQAEKEILTKLSPRDLASETTKLVKFSWRKDGFGAIMMADFTIRNDSPYAVKDVHILCEHSAASGTVIDHNSETIYNIVPAHSTRRFKDVNMGFIASQVAGSRCEIQSVNLALDNQ